MRDTGPVRKFLSLGSRLAAILGATAVLLLATSTTVVAARQTLRDGAQAGVSAREIAKPRATKATPAKNLSPLPWIPPDIDKSTPALDPGVACPLSQVVAGAGQRMKELVENLQKFDATEDLEHFNLDASGSLSKPETRKFDYVAIINPALHGGFQVEEYRNGSVAMSQFPAKIATTGLVAMALIFHPVLASDFNFTCEGLGRRANRPAWLVHFAQRTDRLSRIRAYVIGDRHYPLPLKGRVWIDADTHQIRRLESELMRPLPEIKLTEEYMAIDYGSVQFQTHGQQLWLPLNAEVYWERRKQRFYRRHSFSNFKIFEVDSAQQIQEPQESYCFKNTSDRDITGILSVSPASGIPAKAVSIRFTIPSGTSVCKFIGPGKDVSMRGDEVGSAILMHNGPVGSITADSILPNESTLDLIAESSVAVGP